MKYVDFLKTQHAVHMQMYEALPALFPLISEVGTILQNTIKNGGKILLCGNGGSAADSQHIAAEIVGRFQKERKGLPSIALTTDTSILTSVGNDYGYDYIFARQVEALCTPKDVLIGLTTSGNSANVVRAIEAANTIGAITIGLTGGTGGKMNGMCTHNIVVPSNVTARVQEAHIFIGHCLCEIIESD
ncbi:MAG TPA: D-sedoheptulose 7-phosphate isomerase [Methylophilus sp.]|nr:D-sedoheptulose 7-phosphate isomerase [Methylophilus sp.]HQQ32538.1 D-sedoheptulose 7-phosphate isomerase [Methylophilus sp.]